MTNAEKLQELFEDVFLLEDGEYSEQLTQGEVDTWDSLGVVSLAVAVDEVFGYHMTPEEAMSIDSVASLTALLETKGIEFT